MNDEIEIKILNINISVIRKKLRVAVKIKKVFQRNTFYKNNHTEKFHHVVRLRAENNRCWLTVKSPAIIRKNHKIRREYELELPSYKFGHEMLILQGFRISGMTEAKREYYKLFGCSVEIIIMPRIPPFLEIEGSMSNILKVAKHLGYSKKDYVTKNILQIYYPKQKYVKFK